MRRLSVATVVLVLSGITMLDARATELRGYAMLEALKDGGYVVYLRHDRSDTSRSDADPIDLADCTKQRPLSDAGRAHARLIGVVFKTLGIPVEQVFASPVCRSAETAALAFPDIRRTAPRALVYTLALPKEELVAAADELKKMLAMAPSVGTNTVLVGHTTNLKEAAGLWPKHEGGALIFRPDAHGGFTVVGAIDPADFDQTVN